jgi:hypothetical protein
VEDAVAAWRDAAAADHHDRDFAVDRVSFHRQLGNDTVTNIAPWLLQGASSDDDDDDMYDAETETDEVTTLYVSVDVEPHDSDVRALLDGVRFEEVG